MFSNNTIVTSRVASVIYCWWNRLQLSFDSL